MTLTVDAPDRTVTITLKRDDYTAAELAEVLTDLLAGVGYVFDGRLAIVEEHDVSADSRG